MGAGFDKYPAKAAMRRPVFGFFTFTTAGTSDPTVWDDNNTGIISGITETGTGLFTVTLNKSYVSIGAIADIASVDHVVKVTSTTANTILIQNYDNADPHAAETTTGDVVTVLYMATDS